MSFLTDYSEAAITYKGKKYRLDLAYDTVLSANYVATNPDIDIEDKLWLVTELLVKRKVRLLTEDSYRLIEAIYKEKINFQTRPAQRPRPKVVDFMLDGDYIFASFYQDYGIDLLEQQGKLQWKKFIVLFQGLSEKTKIREIMRIRSMKVPPYNGKNQEERQQILDLKSFYALPVNGGGGQEGLDRLWNALESMATREG